MTKPMDAVTEYQPPKPQAAAAPQVHPGWLPAPPTVQTWSTPCDAIAGALAKAQGQMGNVAKDKRGTFGMYADLAGIVDAVRPALSANAIAYTQSVTVLARRDYLETRFTHASGQWVRSLLELPQQQADNRNSQAQKYGALLTYYRRYGLSSLAGVAADEDIDGADQPYQQQGQGQQRQGGKRQGGKSKQHQHQHHAKQGAPQHTQAQTLADEVARSVLAVDPKDEKELKGVLAMLAAANTPEQFQQASNRSNRLPPQLKEQARGAAAEAWRRIKDSQPEEQAAQAKAAALLKQQQAANPTAEAQWADYEQEPPIPAYAGE